ncbi:hypothetical protein QCE62_15570 [Caballeronia sp. LZ033]|uniref:hypothetical protein n=1 Tax=Caballeronia sp. LZ033 TaxID=3038566 RepID=UPI00285D144B|nr:hypothetical protein [Caballeronia sp. LZ033]MDR5814999.1 hypothetical protein [Caballeronia sp. LZ033]
MKTFNSTFAEERGRLPHISWSAAFVGFVVALMTYLFLAVIGTAIGAGAFDPLTNRNPFSGFGTAASIWVGVSTLLALAVGGFFAGRTAPQHGALHGMLTWALTTLATLYFVSSAASGVVGAAAGVAGQGISLAGQGLAAVTPTVASGVKAVLDQNGLTPQMGDLENRLKTLLQESGKSALSPKQLASAASAATADGASSAERTAANPQSASTDLQEFLDRLKQKAQPAMNAADRDALVNIIVAHTGKSRVEAQQIADNYEQTYNQAIAKIQSLKQVGEQKAREAGNAASASVSHVAWAAALVLVLGGAISALFGLLGLRWVRKNDQPPLQRDQAESA